MNKRRSQRNQIVQLGSPQHGRESLSYAHRVETLGCRGTSGIIVPGPMHGTWKLQLWRRRSSTNSLHHAIWNRTATAEGEPNERTIDNKVFKWCGVCERWFFGDRGHFTHEHVPGYVVNNRRSIKGSQCSDSGGRAICPSIGQSRRSRHCRSCALIRISPAGRSSDSQLLQMVVSELSVGRSLATLRQRSFTTSSLQPNLPGESPWGIVSYPFTTLSVVSSVLPSPNLHPSDVSSVPSSIAGHSAASASFVASSFAFISTFELSPQRPAFPYNNTLDSVHMSLHQHQASTRPFTIALTFLSSNSSLHAYALPPFG